MSQHKPIIPQKPASRFLHRLVSFGIIVTARHSSREEVFCHSMRTLRQCLFDCDLALLRAMAAQWGVELPTNRHDDAVDALTARLADPAAQAETWASLPDAERQALGAILSAGGAMPAGAFARRCGEIRPMGPGRLERERPWESPVSVAESLWYRGLVFKAFDQGPGEMQEVIFVPLELHGGLMTDSVSSNHSTLAPMLAPSATRQAGAQLADDLCSFLAYIYSTSVNTAPGEPLPARHLKTFGRQLRDRDLTRLDLLTHLAARLSLVKPDATPLRPDPQEATAWLQMHTLQQQRTLFEGWRESETWNDLWRVPSLRCEDTGSWRNDPLAARRVALDTLATLESGAWYRLEDFVAAIREATPDFERPGGDYTTWYIRDATTNYYLTGFESWDLVEGALLRLIVGGPLRWLGVVDLDASATVFCMTPTGRWLLGQGDAPPVEEDTSFVVHADGRVEIGAARRYDRFQLSRVADWTESGAVYIYRIAPSSLERARTQRIGPDRIISFLQEASPVPAPEALVGALRRWGTRGTEAWAQQAAVLRLARPELLDQLIESPRTRNYIRETISSTVALVAPRDWPDLLAAMMEMGLLPEINTEPGE